MNDNHLDGSNYLGSVGSGVGLKRRASIPFYCHPTSPRQRVPHNRAGNKQSHPVEVSTKFLPRVSHLLLCLLFASCSSSSLLPCSLPCYPPCPPSTSPSSSLFSAFLWWRVTNSSFRCPPPPQRWTGPGHHGPPGQLVAPTVATTARGRAPPRRLCTGVVTAPEMTSPRPTVPAECVAVSMATIPSVCRADPPFLLAAATRPQGCQHRPEVPVIIKVASHPIHECQSSLQWANKPLEMPVSQEVNQSGSPSVDEPPGVF